MPVGLRERKKERTRAAIAEAALELFAKQGFERTTVAEIADRAEVSPRTFFSYYPTKEDVLFGDIPEKLEAMRRRLSERRPGESAVEALRAHILAEIADPEFSDAEEVRRHRLIRETPALAAYELAHVDAAFQEVFAEAFATDLGLAPTDLAPRMVAASASAALRAMVDYYAEGDASDDPEALIDEALRFLETGLAALGPPPEGGVAGATPAPAPSAPARG